MPTERHRGPTTTAGPVGPATPPAEGHSSDGSLERLGRAGLFGLAVLAWGISGRADPDLWWHLQLGDQILGAGFPVRDLHSFTFHGRALVDHEWATQLFMLSLFRLGGVQLLNFAFAVLASATFYLVYCLSLIHI